MHVTEIVDYNNIVLGIGCATLVAGLFEYHLAVICACTPALCTIYNQHFSTNIDILISKWITHHSRTTEYPSFINSERSPTALTVPTTSLPADLFLLVEGKVHV
jgi:hypothetical protein